MLQVLIILFSFLGWYLLLFHIFDGQKTALYPAVLTSSIIVAGFMFGLAGCMQQGFSFIYCAGLFLLPFCIYQYFCKHNRLKRPCLKDLIPFAVFSIGAVWVHAALDRYFLYNFDDFSHWGRIAQVISDHMRFPIESDDLSHASYVPGSALFIGFVTNILGSSDETWMFAQGILLLSFWIALLSASKNVWIQTILSVFIVAFMNYNTPLRALFVDNLLAAATFAGIVACLENRHTEEKRYTLALSLILCSIILIKTSGLFFVALIIMYDIYVHRGRRRKLIIKLLFLLLPILLYILWNIYIDLNISEGLKHQLSLNNYQGIFGEKSSDDIAKIFGIILPIIVNPLRNTALFLIPGYVVLLILYKQQGALRSNRQTVFLAALLFFVYEIGILLMYIFSMPMKEVIAQNGQDYDRYNGTITAILSALLLHQLASLKFSGFGKDFRVNQFFSFSAGMVLTAFTYYILSMNIASMRTIEYQISKYQTAYQFSLMQEALAEIPSNSECIVYINEKNADDSYCRTMSKYHLRTENFVHCYDENTARNLCASMPWAYYIDLSSGIVYAPTETIGKVNYTRTVSTKYNNCLDLVGYKENSRYSFSTETDITMYDMDTTGYIPVRTGDVIRLSNVSWYLTADRSRIGIYCFTDDRDFVSDFRFNTAEDLSDWAPVYNPQENIIQIVVPSNISSSVAYLRITCQDINSNSVITINEEIQ